MDKKLKKLNRLNKEVEKGRVRFAVRMSIFITIGFTLSKFFVGGFGSWLFGGCLVSFIIGFSLSLFMWDSYLKKAHKLAFELGQEPVVPIEQPLSKSATSFIIIIFLLSIPVIFKQPIQEWALRTVQNAKIKIRIDHKKGKEQLVEIENAYLNNEVGKYLKMPLLGGIPQVTLLAKIDDMRPVLSPKQESSNVKYYVTPFGLSPVSNLNNLAIVVAGLNMLKTEDLRQYYLKSHQDIELEGVAFKVFEFDGQEMKIAYRDSKNESLFILCKEKLCVLNVSVLGVLPVGVFVNVTRIGEWKDIETKVKDFFIHSVPSQ